MREWIETAAWGEDYFEPERLGSKTVLHTATFSGPLVGLLINGQAEHAPWRADEFFQRLQPLAERYPCSWLYVTDPDNALSVIHWEQPYDRTCWSSACLWVFETTPADEGGMSRLVLAFHDRRGLLVFVFNPGESFEIAFHGQAERLAAIRACLEGEGA